jgi:hypothetical protein
MPDEPLLMGWRERVDFPVWGLRRIRAKVDTGARTSALHVESYRLYEDAERRAMVEINLDFPRRRTPLRVTLKLPVVRLAHVRNSGGQAEERPVVATTLRLGPIVKDVEITITNRQHMRFPMLIGRKALEGSFIVDVRQGYLLA